MAIVYVNKPINEKVFLQYSDLPEQQLREN